MLLKPAQIKAQFDWICSLFYKLNVIRDLLQAMEQLMTWMFNTGFSTDIQYTDIA